MSTNSAHTKMLIAAIALAAGTTAAHAQVVLNEVLSNPVGSGSIDDQWEYVELYGTPGMKLDGYAIAAVFGGADPDGDNIPGPLPAGWDSGDELAEIDEAWSLDGRTIGSNGFLVIFNNNANNSKILPLLPAATNRASFVQCHIPTTDTAGRIKNDGSSTYVLVRKRPDQSLNAGGLSVYGPNYAWRKDINTDVNYNSRIDFGGPLPLGGELSVFGEDQSNVQNIAVPSPSILEPYQMVDDIAISNGGGKEYTRSSQQEISDTPGYNPDSFSRVAFYDTNPQRGSRLNSLNVIADTSMSDEEFIYGEQTTTVASLRYNIALAGGPTDPNGPKYNALGQLDASGTFLLDDINLTGFKLTPGTFNDVNSTSLGGIDVIQFRFVAKDYNFDGAFNAADYALILSRLGATLDDNATLINNKNTVDTADDVAYTGWKWQGREFQAILAMMNANTTDGPGGINATFVTALDVAASFVCTADFDADGFLTGDDFDAYVLAFEAGAISSDFDGDGFVTGDDFDAYVVAFESGC